MKMKIRVSEFNEVCPSELDKLFAAGARLIKSSYANGKCIGDFFQNGKKVRVYSDDDISINNIVLPLSVGAHYNSEIEINVI